MSTVDNPPPGSVPEPAAMSTSGAAVSRPSGLIWMMVLAGGLLAGLAGFGFGELALKLFAPSLELPPGIKGDQTLAPLEHARRLSVSQDRVATASYGFLGALLGLTLGVVGGLSRRSARGAVTSGLIGLVLGGTLAAGTTFLILPWHHAHFAPPSPDNVNQQLGLSVATRGTIWMIIGAVAGLALGRGLGGGRVARAVAGGILGAAAAAVIHEIAGAVLFPLDKTSLLIAMTSTPRLLAHLTLALCVSAGTVWAAFHLSLRGDSVNPRV